MFFSFSKQKKGLTKSGLYIKIYIVTVYVLRKTVFGLQTAALSSASGVRSTAKE